MVVAADAAAADEAATETEPVAGPSGLCGQRPDTALSPNVTFTDALEEVCTTLNILSLLV